METGKGVRGDRYRQTSTFREFSKRREDGNHQLEAPIRRLKADLDLRNLAFVRLRFLVGNLQRDAERQWIITDTQCRA